MQKTNVIAALLLLTIFLPSCKKESVNHGNSNNSSSGGYYFKGTLNGQALNWQVTNNLTSGWVTGNGSSLNNNNGEIYGGLTATISNFGNFEPLIGFEFKTIDKKPADNESTVFNSFVNTGSWTLAVDDNSTISSIGTKSLIIIYVDSSGKGYTSLGSQSGNTVNVVSVAQTPAQGLTNESLKIKLTFSCTLYPDDGTSNSLSLTNGEATIFLEDLVN